MKNMKTSIISGLLAIVTLLLIVGNESLTSGELFQRTIARQNFGFILQEKRQVHFSIAVSKLIFYYRLPTRELNISLVDVDCSNESRLESMGIPATVCTNAYSLVGATHRMRMAALNYLQTQMNMLDELLTEISPARDGREKRGWWTDSWSWVTGLAREEDVEDVQDVLDVVERGVKKAADVWKAGSSTFIAAIEIERKRIDNLYEILTTERLSFIELHKQILAFRKQRDVRHNILGHLIENTRKLAFQMSEIDHVYNAVQMLLSGRLSHFILDHAQQQSALNWLQRRLDADLTGLVVLKNDTNYYYHQGTFRVFKYRSHLVINLFIPLTVSGLNDYFSVYMVKPVPLASPDGDERHHTMINVDFDAVIYNRNLDYYSVVKNLAELPSTVVINLHNNGLVLRTRNMRSCALMLIEGSLADIREHCSYTIVMRPLPSEVIKIDVHKILISNLKTVSIQCPLINYGKIIELTEKQTVFDVKCSCSMMIEEFYLIESSIYCTDDADAKSMFDPKYIINLPYLSAFVNND